MPKHYQQLPPKVIPLEPHGRAIIDADRFHLLQPFTWHTIRKQKSTYAYTISAAGTSTRKIWMHRFIARTPGDMICHHRNRNSLDNRRANLVNMDPHQHMLLHQNNSLSVKFDPESSEKPDIF